MFRSLATYRSEHNFGCLFKAVKPILTQWGLSGALYDLYYMARGEGNSWELGWTGDHSTRGREKKEVAVQPFDP